MNKTRTRQALLISIGIALIAGFGVIESQSNPPETACQIKYGRHILVTPINTNPQKPEASTSNAANLLVRIAIQDSTVQYCTLPKTKMIGVFVTKTTSEPG